MNDNNFDLRHCLTVVELLQQRAISQPTTIAYTFLSDGAAAPVSMTYGQLAQQARAIAALLQQRQATGSRALLLYPPGLDFIAAFMGCLYAGVVAVPMYPPRRNQRANRLQGAIQSADARFALTTVDTLSVIEQSLSFVPALAAIECITTDNINSDLAQEWRIPQLQPADLAFLQYTSGSTAAPKGVMVSHRNLLHNSSAIYQAFGHDNQSRVVSWLPLYHDMGLIGGVLQPLYGGFPAVLMSPVNFLQKPWRWLQAITDYGATSSGGPNFAYDLCVEKITEAQRTELDLSTWKVAFNGAEPVRAETLERFTAAFAPCGFRREMFYPCYGMAEATLFVTGGDHVTAPAICQVESAALEKNQILLVDSNSKNHRRLVSAGHRGLDTTITIVDPETLQVCPIDRVGEIWVSSPSVAQGYWQMPEASAACFIPGDSVGADALLQESTKPQFLRTGDLGFLQDSELYVTGRLKDVIIVRGRNHYPQDIELTVAGSHPALKASASAAFSVEVAGEEQLVIVQEVERQYLRQLPIEAVLAAIRAAVSQDHELLVHRIVLLKPVSILKTSSGKIQRQACKKAFLEGSLQIVHDTGATMQEVATPVTPEMQFSLLYFSSDEAEFADDKYKLLLAGAKFADRHSFTAVWTPERHFHAFGGLYPNPSVVNAALALTTERLRLRAGSVVMPLHDPLRVAEEWSVVDNLSHGRVDLAFARGWNPNDFVLAPDAYADSAEILFAGIAEVQHLWKGGKVSRPNGVGALTEVQIYPLPQQTDLAVWVTCTGGKERFIEAGERGLNILTALLFQPVADLAEKIVLYREARARHGHDPATGQVTLMLHTFVGEDLAVVRHLVKEPFIEYIKSSVNLWQQSSQDLAQLSLAEQQKLLDYAFERYYQTSALFGTPESCLEMVKKLQQIGVNEIACLIDFGVPAETVLNHLPSLNRLKNLINGEPAAPLPPQTPATALPTTAASWLPSVAPVPAAPAVKSGIMAIDQQTLSATIVKYLAIALKQPPEKIAVDQNFHSFGIDSLKAVEVITALESHLEISLSPTLLFEYSTPRQLAAHLIETYGFAEPIGAGLGTPFLSAVPHNENPADRVADMDIAVIGMSGRFPQAPNLSAFWELLQRGGNAITEVPAHRWQNADWYSAQPTTALQTSSRWGGFVADIDQFDPLFFQISPREAALMDPQQRLFLEVAWEALEDAGYAADRLAQQPIGVFVGCSNNGYYRRIEPFLAASDYGAGIGNQNAIIANRLSFLLNLRGPSMLVDTMCSSSLVAIHLACQSIRQGDCTGAIVGGVNLQLSPEYYAGMSRMKMHSPDGQCKTFDAAANGIVLGEGAGAVLLKPLAQAVADGDQIYGVIKGSAMNHDGQTNGLTAPNPRSQAELIEQALQSAQLSAADISYIEAHGTGTALGDPIEIEGLTKAFRKYTPQRQFCRIGSVKTNIGHLEAAAGIAQLLKVLLAMKHGQLPPSLHFNQANPLIPFAETPFMVNTQLTNWSGVQYAGVSSFGIGGTNAHLILGTPPVRARQNSAVERPLHILNLSAKNSAALHELVDRYLPVLTGSEQIADICFTANSGRNAFADRLSVWGATGADLAQHLRSYRQNAADSAIQTGQTSRSTALSIAYLCTGQGSQYVNMGRTLYETQPIFRQALLECDRLLQPELEHSLLEALYPTSVGENLLDRVLYSQTAIFAIEYAIAQVWANWGVRPTLLLGHSLGEYVAACLAGVFSLADALKLVVQRARYAQELTPPGEMVAVFASPTAIAALVTITGQQVVIAAYNSAENTVLSGDAAALTSICETLAANGIRTQKLASTRAFHSPLLKPMVAEFRAVAQKIVYQQPQIPLISNVTGQLVTTIDAEYWVQHLVQPVQYTHCLATLQQQHPHICLEIGSKPTLISLGKQSISDPELLWLPSLRSGVADWEQLLTSLGALWIKGVVIDWSGFDQDYGRQRLSLPTYPFQRQRYWLGGEPMPDSSSATLSSAPIHPASSVNEYRSPMTTAHPTDTITTGDRLTTLLNNLNQMVARLLKANVADISVHTPFLEIGADSLVLVEAVNQVEVNYGVKVTLRQLFEEVSTVAALAEYLDRQLPPEIFSPSVLVGSPPRSNSALAETALHESKNMVASNFAGNGAGAVEIADQQHESAITTVMQQQIASMSSLFAQQLELLQGVNSLETAIKLPAQPPSSPDALPVAVKSFSTPPETPPNRLPVAPLSASFVAKYNQQTAASKQRAQADRAMLADSRATAGFRPSTKELIYPIVGERAQGARFWDIDGNEYIDLTMGFGVLLFGHNPDFVAAAIAAQCQRGIQIGPQANHAGTVAQLICKLTGVERVAFCNSGTEAVMTAVRLARTASGRPKIALFAGSYHGHFDGILAKAGLEQQGLPSAPGILPGTVADVLVLNYDDPAGSLAMLQQHAQDLAAVLVEPVQARRPDLQPREFLQQLRELTTAAGIALIFDEVLVGFRIQAGGAQAWAGVQADIVTYGKIVGGGIPIGVVAGTANYLDGIDGGWWQYGDSSYPSAERTFFAGTFNKNHLGMAVAAAVLQYLQDAGPELYQQLNQRTATLAERLNKYFAEQAIPMQIVYFGSLFRFTYSGNFDIFFQHLLLHGVYVWEGRNCFLSTAHTDADLDQIVQAVQAAIQEMRGAKLWVNTPAATAVDLLPNDTLDIKAVIDRQNLPLSLAQQRLWFLDQLEPHSAFYNMPAAVRLRGQVQTAILEQTLQTIIQRHEILRTNFVSQQGQPVQVIHPQLDWRLATEITVGQSSAEIQQLITNEAQRPFQLDSDPLIRAILWEVSPTESILLLVLHHIIADGLSMAVLVQEIAAIYPALCLNQPHPLPPLAIQYADFALWQRQWLQGATLQTQLDFWQQQLADVPTVLELPIDRPRPAIQTVNGAHYQFRLAVELTDQLQKLSQKMGVTLFMTLLTAFDILLYRHTRQTDILVGSPIASRNQPATQQLIGLFLNILLLRVDLAGNPSFQELLHQVRRVTLDAYTHPDVPFEQLLAVLQPERDLSHSPLFQVMLILDQANPIESQPLPDLVIETLAVENFTAKLDLTLTLENQPTGLVGDWEYNTDLFDRATIVRMAEQFEHLLTAIVANPKLPIEQLPLLTTTAQQQLLAQSRGTVQHYADQCLHQVIEAQVARTPQALAVVWDDQCLTYQELNNRANQLAHYLQSQGVTGRVGIYLERSGDTLVAVLAVLKIGIAYVPLDPSYPVDRLAYMLSNGQVNCLLTATTITTPIPQAPVAIVYLDRDWPTIALSPTTNLECSIDPASLAYVIYTSGSTGNPKGVMVSHRSLVNAYHGWESAYQLRDTRSHLQMASFSFDVFAGDYIRALASGAQLVICPRDYLLEPAQLYGLIQRAKIDCAEFVPAVMRLLAEYLVNTGQNLSQMHLIAVGSDRWYVQEYQQWQQLCGAHTRLINSYGVSEATIDSCYFETKTIADLPHEALVPVGRPFPNVQLYVLEPTLQPSPIGVPGELYIGGVGVAQGYDGRPDLTADHFIVDPFSNQPAAKLYRTGDLARYNATGDLEYLGRIDQQVKIRGLRIELAEIAVVLQAQAEIQQATVLVWEDRPGQSQLVAYIVCQPEITLTTAEVRRVLQKKLPEYMIPNICLFLAEIPLTPNGKVDRRALPRPEVLQTVDYVPPQTADEVLLAEIWCELLQVNRVGIHDNFFELGGHSLLATQLVSRIRSALGVELPVRSLFTASTIAELMIEIATAQPRNDLISLQPVDRTTPLPLSFAQQRLWFLDRLATNQASYNIPTRLYIRGAVAPAVLEESLRLVLDRHEALRTTFQEQDGQAIQTIQTAVDWSMEVLDFQHHVDPQRAVDDYVQRSAQQPFDLSADLPLRATLLQISHDHYALLLTLHHIAADGWSVGVLVQEIASIYPALLRGDAISLPPLTIQYADFAHWQRQYLAGNSGKTQLAYWQTQLADAPAILALPTDHPRPPVPSGQGRQYQQLLPLQLTIELEQVSQTAGTTMFMALLAIFDILLYRYTGQTDLVVGTPIANRNFQELEKSIGFFVNTLVLRTDLADQPSFRELLGRVRETTLEAYTHQDTPFELVVEALQPERDLSYSPVFQVAFALQNTPFTDLVLPDLVCTPSLVDNGTAKFDLTLTIDLTDQGYVGTWEYSTDLFEIATIKQLALHYQQLLTAVVTNPDQPITTLMMLTATEHQRLLTGGQNTDLCPNPDFDQVGLPQLFWAQAARTPQAIAIKHLNNQITYQELAERATSLAAHLQQQKVASLQLVGLLVDRSPEMIVGMLAILMVGGAYVPLDTSAPTDRLALILADTQLSLLLTQSALLDRLPTTTASVICLDDWAGDRSSWPTSVDLFQPQSITGNDPAYVIYTSGSTGKPKGVVIPHQAISQLVIDTNYIQVDPSDCIAQAANSAFDATTFEVWAALLNGASISIVPTAVLMSPLEFATHLQQDQVTTLFLTTALFNRLASIVPTVFQQLRYLLFGGESVDPQWVKAILTAGAPEHLLHVYGPTESTTFATWFEITNIDAAATNIPIGHPLSNTYIYVLDSHQQPVPIGVPGELYIGGTGLALEYLHQPELTASKFVIDPFAAGQRLYRTGDLVRYLPTGEIEYLGRIDQQVKIRGFRIELGEVEALITQHPLVQEAVVIVQKDAQNHKRLVAYVVTEATAQELDKFIRTKLPDYMVPATFVTMAHLPLTANGKVDQRALPLPEWQRSQEFVAPSNPVESTLASIWSEVLGIAEIGIKDNFFELGGDSILSLQIIARSQQAGIQITAQQLFNHQSIQALATVADQAANQVADQFTQKILAPQGLVTGEASLTPVQQWFFAQQLTEPHYFNQSVMLQVPANIQIQQLDRALQAVLAHHDALRLQFATNWQPCHTEPLPIWPLAVIDLSALSPNDLATAIEQQSQKFQACLDLATGKLLQAVLYQAGSEQPGRLLLIIHHLVVDGVSWRILLADLLTAYQQCCQGVAVQLPPKTTAWQTWTERLAAYSQTTALDSELTWWQNQLPVFDPPVRPRSTVATLRKITTSLSAPETQLLLQVVPAVYHTQINDVLLTALLQAWADCTGNRSLLVELEGHGREELFSDLDISRTVGWFTTIFPVCLSLSDEDDLGRQLTTVKEQLRQIPQRGIGYGILRYLSPQKHLLPTYTADISFNYLGQFEQTLDSEGNWALANESGGAEQHSEQLCSYSLAVSSLVVDEQLQLSWSYDATEVVDVEQLSTQFMICLRGLIEHCQDPQAGAYTPSDFPEAGLNQAELDDLIASFTALNS